MNNYYSTGKTKARGCFFCGENDHSLIDDPKAFYTPCLVCQALMQTGITLIGATSDETEGIPPIAAGEHKDTPPLFPTGRWIVMEQELAEKILGDKLMGRMECPRKGIAPDEFVADIQTMCGRDKDATYLTMDDFNKTESAAKGE